jgi:hypothetical protein
MGWLQHFTAVWLFGNHSGRRLPVRYAAVFVCRAAATRFQSEHLVSERETQTQEDRQCRAFHIILRTTTSAFRKS